MFFCKCVHESTITCNAHANLLKPGMHGEVSHITLARTCTAVMENRRSPPLRDTPEVMGAEPFSHMTDATSTPADTLQRRRSPLP